MDITLTKNQRLVAKAAITDSKDNRNRIKNVHITKGAIEACDGYMLVRKNVNYDGDEILLDAKEIDRLQDPKPKTSVVLTDKGDDMMARGKYGRTLIAKSKEAYPNTEQLIPKGKPVFKIALSRSVLRKFLSTLDNSDIPLCFYFYGDKEPVKVTETTETTAIIMPMFIEWKPES